MAENGAKTVKKWYFFGFLVKTSRVLEWDMTKRAGIVSQTTQNYNSTLFSFKILQRAEYCGSLYM